MIERIEINREVLAIDTKFVSVASSHEPNDPKNHSVILIFETPKGKIYPISIPRENAKLLLNYLPKAILENFMNEERSKDAPTRN